MKWHLEDRIFLLGLLLVPFSLGFGQRVVQFSGLILDDGTGEAIPFANIVVKGKNIGTAADSAGRFRLRVPPDEDSCTIVYSHVAYDRVSYRYDISNPKEYDVRIRLKMAEHQLPEIVVRGAPGFRLARTLAYIDGGEFEKLGYDRMEFAMRYLLPRYVQPLEVRMTNPRADFTLYINDEWFESIYLNDLNPHEIRQVAVWTEDFAPLGYPLHRGGIVIAIWTTDFKPKQ